MTKFFVKNYDAECIEETVLISVTYGSKIGKKDIAKVMTDDGVQELPLEEVWTDKELTHSLCEQVYNKSSYWYIWDGVTSQCKKLETYQLDETMHICMWVDLTTKNVYHEEILYPTHNDLLFDHQITIKNLDGTEERIGGIKEQIKNAEADAIIANVAKEIEKLKELGYKFCFDSEYYDKGYFVPSNVQIEYCGDINEDDHIEIALDKFGKVVEGIWSVNCDYHCYIKKKQE